MSKRGSKSTPHINSTKHLCLKKEIIKAKDMQSMTILIEIQSLIMVVIDSFLHSLISLALKSWNLWSC